MATGEEPDLDYIRRLLADVARTVGIRIEQSQIANTLKSQQDTEKAGDRRDAGKRRLSAAIAWMRALNERDRVFGDDMFFDPAWNMLLDLYVSEGHGALVSVSSLCIAAKVPATTALRWLAMLEKRALIVRRADAQDRRRSFLFLTDEAKAKLETALEKAIESTAKSGVIPFH